MRLQADARTAFTAIISVLWAGFALSTWTLHVTRVHLFIYDDAFMFYRYAYNLHHYHAITWNPGGSHTYGTTSLPWLFVVTVFSYLPVGPQVALELASSVFFLLTVIVVACVLPKQLQSSILVKPWNIFFTLICLCTLSTTFLTNATGGMETMLSLLANSMVCLLALHVIRNKTSQNTWIFLPLAAFLAYFVRPESGICDLILPSLAIVFFVNEKKLQRIFCFLLSTCLLIGIELVACKMYFGTALPLSFYAKSTSIANIYWNVWPINLFDFSGLLVVCLAAIVMTASKNDIRLVSCYLVPVFFTFAYLSTIIQLSGEAGRYYCAYLPYFFIPAFTVVDSRLANNSLIPANSLLVRLCIATAITSAATVSYGHSAWQFVVWLTKHQSVETNTRSFRSNDPVLPQIQLQNDLVAFSDDVACRLPNGTKIAAGEDGYLSAQCHNLPIVDMGGLNDNVIARTGFSAKYVLQKKPDIIWMPNPDFYDLWRQKILFNHEFQANYDYIADAFDFGIAIRKDSPYYAQILTVLRQAWPKYYPNTCIAPICTASHPATKS